MAFIRVLSGFGHWSQKKVPEVPVRGGRGPFEKLPPFELIGGREKSQADFWVPMAKALKRHWNPKNAAFSRIPAIIVVLQVLSGAPFKNSPKPPRFPRKSAHFRPYSPLRPFARFRSLFSPFQGTKRHPNHCAGYPRTPRTPSFRAG